MAKDGFLTQKEGYGEVWHFSSERHKRKEVEE